MMIKKLLFLFIFLFAITSLSFAADNFTVNYNLVIPEEGSRDWLSKISGDIISIDAFINMLSDDAPFYINSGGNAELINVSTDTLTARTKMSADDLLTSGANTFYSDGSAGKVGIGTLTPGSNLSVKSTLSIDSAINSYPFIIYNALGKANVYVYEEADSDVYFSLKDKNDITGVLIDTEGNNYFGTGTTACNVGIGTNTPTVSLDVVGDIYASGIMSNDAIKFSANATVSADVTNGAPCLVVSKDPAGVNHLNFYNGTSWKKVTLE